MSQSPVYHSILSCEGVLQEVNRAYAFKATECRFLKQGINDIYLIESGGNQYIFRLARTARFVPFDEDTYNFELTFLKFLEPSQCRVALPIERADGSLLGYLEHAEGRRYYALFQFVEGGIHFPEQPEEAKLIGRSLAQLHEAGFGF